VEKKGNQFLPRQAQLLLCFPAEIPRGIQSHAPNNRRRRRIFYTENISKKGGETQTTITTINV
jgi:hypothetical protein